MGEVKFDLNAYGVKYQCDRCRIGEMQYTGVDKISKSNMFDEEIINSIEYEHKCNACNYILYFNVIYPTVRYNK